MNTQTNYSPLRSFGLFQPFIFDGLQGEPEQQTYPAHDIVATGENDYLITLSVPGFAQNELSIEFKDQQLKVSGTHEESNQSKDTRFLVQNIVTQNFERTFRLPENVRVVDADLKNGLLQVNLHREVPEDQKPLRIEINAPQAKTIEHVSA